MCAGYDADTSPSEGTEEASCDAGGALHVFADDSHRGKPLFGGHVVDLTLRALERKLFVEGFYGAVSVFVTHGEGGVVLRAGLRDHEDAYTVLSQGLEDAVIDSNHADHTEALHGDEASVVDRRDAGDEGPFAVLATVFLRDERTWRLEVKGVADADGDIFVIDGVNRWRIDDFRTEITKLHRLDEGELVDDVGRIDHARVCRHESIYVRPNFEL